MTSDKARQDDRKLLELAAKAAGYIVESYQIDDKGNVTGAWVYERDAQQDSEGEYPIFLWKPQLEDGDALRLAVKLGLSIDPNTLGITVGNFRTLHKLACYESITNDPYAATRRAIERAAAEIGKAMV